MHATRIRVRFDEVDEMGVVHHPRYLIWFEVARTRYLRDLGMRYRDVVRAGTRLAVVEVGVRYARPARYDEVVTVHTRCTESRGATITLAYEVRRRGALLADGFTRLASIDARGRARRMPETMRTTFDAAIARENSTARTSSNPPEDR